MLHNDAPWGGLEAYQRGVTWTKFVLVKIGKSLIFFLRVSMHYHINA